MMDIEAGTEPKFLTGESEVFRAMEMESAKIFANNT
jgi:hypothetical protein